MNLDIYLSFTSHAQFSILFLGNSGGLEMFSGQYLEHIPDHYSLSCSYYDKQLGVLAERFPADRKGIRRFFVPKSLNGSVTVNNQVVATFRLTRFGREPFLTVYSQSPEFTVIVEKENPPYVVSPLIVSGIPGVKGHFNEEPFDLEMDSLLHLPKPFRKSGAWLGRYYRRDSEVDSKISAIELAVAVMSGFIIIPEFMRIEAT